MGIFTSSSWAFPTNTDGTGGDFSTYTTSTATTVSSVRSVGTVTTSGGSSGNGNLILAAASVPEPSALASLFGATGFLAFLRRRQTE
jgi:hypothetical protein